MSLLQNIRKYRIPLGALLIAALIFVPILKASAIKNQLNAWKFLPQPERLTELYFTRPNNLPASYAPGTSQTVSFTVHNLEYRTTNYHYQIIEQSQDGSAKQQLATGSFTLLQNQSRAVAQPVTLADAGPAAKIAVNLTPANESIDYLVTKAGA